MKKKLFTAVMLLLSVTMQAQIKVHEDNQVSIGCLNGDFGLQITPNGYIYSRTQNNNTYSWANLSMANTFGQKHWIVMNLFNTDSDCYGKHMFYVYGNGKLFYTRQYSISIDNSCLSTGNTRPIDSEEALATILNLTGYYYEEDPLVTPEEIMNNEYVNKEAVEGMIADLQKNSVSLSAKNLAEVFPDAVRTDVEARLCIDYQAITTLLIGAVKQQQKEIDALRKTLQEHGLMEP